MTNSKISLCCSLERKFKRIRERIAPALLASAVKELLKKQPLGSEVSIAWRLIEIVVTTIFTQTTANLTFFIARLKSWMSLRRHALKGFCTVGWILFSWSLFPWEPAGNVFEVRNLYGPLFLLSTVWFAVYQFSSAALGVQSITDYQECPILDFWAKKIDLWFGVRKTFTFFSRNNFFRIKILDYFHPVLNFGPSISRTSWVIVMFGRRWFLQLIVICNSKFKNVLLFSFLSRKSNIQKLYVFRAHPVAILKLAKKSGWEVSQISRFRRVILYTRTVLTCSFYSETWYLRFDSKMFFIQAIVWIATLQRAVKSPRWQSFVKKMCCLLSCFSLLMCKLQTRRSDFREIL